MSARYLLLFLVIAAAATTLGYWSADVRPILSSTTIWSPIPSEEEIGREEAFQRRADHRLPA